MVAAIATAICACAAKPAQPFVSFDRDAVSISSDLVGGRACMSATPTPHVQIFTPHNTRNTAPRIQAGISALNTGTRIERVSRPKHRGLLVHLTGGMIAFIADAPEDRTGQAEIAIGQYINAFYNPKRRHSALLRTHLSNRPPNNQIALHFSTASP